MTTQVSALPTATNDPERLPDFFPKVVSNCQQPAQSFFSCFFKEGVKAYANDTDSGMRGLNSCLNEKKAYQECMFKFEQKTAVKMYRVQEEYRFNPPPHL